MTLLESLGTPIIDAKPLEVEIVKGQILYFRRPGEGEPDKVRSEATKEAKMYYAEEFEPPPIVAEWLPKEQQDFISATTMSHFLLDTTEQVEARKAFCRVAKHRPVTFRMIWDEWVAKVVTSELEGFAKEVDARKNS